MSNNQLIIGTSRHESGQLAPNVATLEPVPGGERRSTNACCEHASPRACANQRLSRNLGEKLTILISLGAYLSVDESTPPLGWGDAARC